MEFMLPLHTTWQIANSLLSKPHRNNNGRYCLCLILPWLHASWLWSILDCLFSNNSSKKGQLVKAYFLQYTSFRKNLWTMNALIFLNLKDTLAIIGLSGISTMANIQIGLSHYKYQSVILQTIKGHWPTSGSSPDFFFSKKLRFFITLELYTYVVTAYLMLLATST